MQALTIEKLYLKRGSFLLRDFNMELEAGQIHVIVGKSGSGKSTLFRAIGGALRPEAGRILYYGKEMYEDELKIRKRMSVIYDAPNFNMELSPERLAREWKKFEPWFDRDAFTSYMNRLELEMNQRVKLYSVEKCRKLMLALALSRKPELLVMDDVTSGVDTKTRQMMWEMVEKYRSKQELTILFSSHHEEEILLADRIWNMDEREFKEREGI